MPPVDPLVIVEKKNFGKYTIQYVLSDDGNGGLAPFDAQNPLTGITLPQGYIEDQKAEGHFSNYIVRYKWTEANGWEVIVAAAKGGVTNTSELVNDGNGLTPFAIESEVVAAEIGNDIQDGINGKKGGYLSISTKGSEIKQAIQVTPDTNFINDNEKNNISRTIRLSDFTGANDSIRLQSAIDAASTQQKKLIIDPGTYELPTVGIDPYYLYGVRNILYCIELKSNLEIEIKAGATLKLSDGTIHAGNSDERVNIFTGRNLTNVKIYGGGIIDGNTEGQTLPSGYYGQTHFGSHIYINTPDNGLTKTNFNIEISGLTLRNHSGNAFNVYGINGITANGLKIEKVGEGIQFSRCVNMFLNGYYFNDSDNVNQGDGFEVVESSQGVFTNMIIENSPIGTGLDLGGSTELTFSNIVVRNFNSGITAETTGTGIKAYNISISNFALIDNASFGLDLSDARMTVSNGIIYGSVYGIRGLYTYAEDGDGTNLISNIDVSGCNYGVDAYDGVVANFYSCDIHDNTFLGVRIRKAGTNELPSLSFFGCNFFNNGALDVQIVQNSDAAWLPTVIIYSCKFDAIGHTNITGDGNIKYFGYDDNGLKTNLMLSIKDLEINDVGTALSKLNFVVNTSSSYDGTIEMNNTGLDIKTNSASRYVRIGNNQQVRIHPSVDRVGINMNPLFPFHIKGAAAGNHLAIQSTVNSNNIFEVFTNSGGSAGLQLREGDNSVHVLLAAYTQNYIDQKLVIGKVAGGESQQLFINGGIGFTGVATDGSTQNNGTFFKGTDGALYWKGGAGTVTKIADA